MSDLPTREAVKASLALVAPAGGRGVLRGILDAYAAGRLVDRDTIDPTRWLDSWLDDG